MEKGFAYVWLHLLLLALFLEKGYSLKCYMCSTIHDPNCYDPSASGMKASECTSDHATTTFQRLRSSIAGFSTPSDFFKNLSGAFSCLKVELVFPQNTGNSTIIRGCQLEKDQSDDICKVISTKTHGSSFLKYCGLCNNDMCNSATRSSAVLGMLLPVVALLFRL